MSSSVRPVPAMIRAVDTIQQAGYKTGVITNNWIDDINEKTNELMTQFLNSHFDVVLQSCQLGIRKPNPLIYRLACHRLEVQPSQAVFLDDLGRNVRAARDVGMTAVRVRETHQALRELGTLLGVRLAFEKTDSSSSSSHVSLKS
ncbi:Bifunctional epoxide hydrolase 2, partial [Geodia barretti]